MNAPYNQDVLAAAEACFAQASQLLYCEPDAEVVADQVAERPFQNAPFGMDDADVREGMALMDAWCVAAAADEAGFDERVAALRREWLRLFVGAGTPDAPSWESFYRDPNSQLFSARTLEVRERYRRHGLQIERLYAEPDDHLGLMLGFVGHLIGLEAEALAVGDGAAAGEATSRSRSWSSTCCPGLRPGATASMRMRRPTTSAGQARSCSGCARATHSASAWRSTAKGRCSSGSS